MQQTNWSRAQRSLTLKGRAEVLPHRSGYSSRRRSHFMFIAPVFNWVTSSCLLPSLHLVSFPLNLHRFFSLPTQTRPSLRRKTVPLIKRFLDGNLFGNLGPLHPGRTRIILPTHKYPRINECIIIHTHNCSGKSGTGGGGKRKIDC